MMVDVLAKKQCSHDAQLMIQTMVSESSPFQIHRDKRIGPDKVVVRQPRDTTIPDEAKAVMNVIPGWRKRRTYEQAKTA